jgi:hypothetical protein
MDINAWVRVVVRRLRNEQRRRFDSSDELAEFFAGATPWTALRPNPSGASISGLSTGHVLRDERSRDATHARYVNG